MSDLENEAAVELRVILPLLYSLGYSNSDIIPKPPVVFQEGRRGRKPEPDYVIYAGPVRNPDTSLIVVEAKKPGEDPINAQKQGESYAFALRAPFLLLCDGIEIEIWQTQITFSSERVFHCRVDELEASRGGLQILIGRSAAIEYARSLRTKSILEASTDFASYENAEIERTRRFENAIDRTLDETSGGDLNSATVLEIKPQGAIIVAGSGMGKTSLGFSLFRQAIAARWADSSCRIAVHIPLYDVSADETIFNFIQQRIIAHKPGFEDDALHDWLRRHGAIVVCDAFDRVSFIRREPFEQQMRNLLRDFPRLQLFVFSRESVRPELPLPILRLQPLNAKERHELAVACNARHRWWNAPDVLHGILGNPLLLRLFIEYRGVNGRYPTGLSQLFGQWLNQTIQSDGSSLKAGRRLEALTALATEGKNQQLTMAAARNTLRRGGLDPSILDDLLQIGALTQEGSVLSFEHEALADHLRALRLAAAPKEQAMAEIEAVTLEPDSLFPVLLMSALTKGDLQGVLWKRLLSINVRSYLSVLQFRHDLTEEIVGEEPDAIARRYLSELLDGIEGPLTAFFPEIQSAVRFELLGSPASALHIIGHASPNNVTYSLRPAENNQSNVEIGSPIREWGLHSVNLQMAGYRLDSGRLLGASRLSNVILKVVERCNLLGGAAWLEERLLSRLSYLSREYHVNFGEPIKIETVIEQLGPHASSDVMYTRALGGFYFQIDQPLSDAIALRKAGKTQLTQWWLFDDQQLIDGTYDEHSLEALLVELYERATRIYMELVEHSFASIKDEMSFMGAQPARWDLQVRKNPNAEFFHTSLDAYWTPVATVAESRPVVRFAEKREDISVYLSTSQAELKRLGRSRGGRVWGSSRLLTSFDQFDLGQYFDGKSPALRMACDWISDDLKYLFDSVPTDDF